ncbi:MAG: hypothetical protein J2P25_12085 [Nocardiopsaceae bacterium]|nr:hypothetical protein [Nocardiopsaceae bacterium]
MSRSACQALLIEDEVDQGRPVGAKGIGGLGAVALAIANAVDHATGILGTLGTEDGYGMTS